jgi:sialidase-1
MKKTIIRGVFPFLLMALLMTACSMDSEGGTDVTEQVLTEQVLFQSGETIGTAGDTLPPESYISFRIPAIVRAVNGDILAFCEGRHQFEDSGNNDIILKRSSDNGVTWDSGIRLADVDVPDSTRDMCMDPNPVVDEDPASPFFGRVWLAFHKTDGDSSPRKQILIYSDDNGATWTGDSSSDPVANPEIVLSDLGITGSASPGHAIQLSSGRIYFQGKGKPFYSDDYGVSWTDGGYYDSAVDGYGLNESMAVQLKSGSLYMNSRRDDNNAGVNGRLFTLSSDQGENWGSLQFDDTLIDQKCQASILRFTSEETDGKNRILFANPAHELARVNMTVRLSYEGEGNTDYDESDGLDWSYSRMIHDGFSAYSDMVIQKDDIIGLLYETDNYETLRYARFTLDWLTEGEDSL